MPVTSRWPGQCLALGTIFIILSTALLPAQRQIKFPRLDGEGTVKAIVIPIDDSGLYVTVGVVAADVTRGEAGQDAFEFVAQDPQSRLTLLKGKSGAVPTEFGQGRNLEPGTLLRRGPKGPAAAVVSWERYFMDQLLPLSFMRVHHQGAIPLPGDPLVKDGKVVALCHQATDSFGKGTFAIPAEAVQRVVAGYKKHGKIRRAFCGINLDARDPIASIIGIRPDSPAAVGGLQKGDIILTLGGRPAGDYTHAIDAFFYLVPGQPVEVVVLRGVKKLPLTITPVPHPGYILLEGEDAGEKEESEKN